MSTATFSSTTSAGSDTSLLRRHWRLLALIVVGFGPFAPSILAMQDFLLADNALGFTPFAFLGALYLFWLRAHSDQPPATRDLFTDVFVGLPLIFIALFILYVTPAQLSWYFWLNRVDLAALAPWTIATALVFIGYQQVLRTWPAWIMLFLTWPYFLVRGQDLLGGPFVWITARVGGLAVDFARLPYTTDPADYQVFTTTNLPEGENFTLIVAQLCSGTAATLGFFIVGWALAWMSRGTAWRRTRWVLLGVTLAFVSNLVRVVVMLALATSVSRDFAVDVMHPILGLVLFLVVTLVMLLLMRPMGLRFDPLPRGKKLAWEPARGMGRGYWLFGGVLVLASFAVTTSIVQAQQYNFIGLGDGVPAVAIESRRGVLPEIPGWELEHQSQISWTDLFGGTSRGDVFAYRAPGWSSDTDPAMTAQAVVTEDLRTLERYTIEQCIDFHNRDLEAREAVDLGFGITGFILHHEEDGVASSILYWVMPVDVDDEVFHARIALFGFEGAPTYLDESDLGVLEGTNSGAVTRIGRALESAGDGLPGTDGDPIRAEIDRGLLAMGIRIVSTMIETGGPADAARDLDGAAVPTAPSTPATSEATPLP